MAMKRVTQHNLADLQRLVLARVAFANFRPLYNAKISGKSDRLMTARLEKVYLVKAASRAFSTLYTLISQMSQLNFKFLLNIKRINLEKPKQ